VTISDGDADSATGALIQHDRKLHADVDYGGREAITASYPGDGNYILSSATKAHGKFCCHHNDIYHQRSFVGSGNRRRTSIYGRVQRYGQQPGQWRAERQRNGERWPQHMHCHGRRGAVFPDFHDDRHKDHYRDLCWQQ
jgi:hypothetical protein